MPTDPSSVEGEQEPNTPSQESGDIAPSSSTTETQDANTPAASSSADGTTPETGEEDANAPKTLYEAVTKALEPEAGEAGSSPAESEKDAAEGGKADADKAQKGEDGEGDGEDKPPPFHDHPRWKQLNRERDELKEQVQKLEVDSQAIDRLQGFMTDQNLSVPEFNMLLKVGGLMKNDPVKALEALRPYYERLQMFAGERLPDDLQQQVDGGYITEDLARQQAVQRGETQRAQFQTQVTQQRHQDDQVAQQQQQQAGLIDTLSDTASTWEQKWQAADPDYSKKAERVREKIELALHGGTVPQNAAEMQQLCEDKRKEVETELRSLLPNNRQEVQSNPSSAAGGHGAAPAPKTMLEAMNQAVAG